MFIIIMRYNGWYAQTIATIATIDVKIHKLLQIIRFSFNILNTLIVIGFSLGRQLRQLFLNLINQQFYINLT